MSHLKKILPFAFILILVLLILNIKNTSRTQYNPDNTSGNTPGNLFNGGLFSEYEDKIYFSNWKDDGSLYSMDLDLNDFTKIHNDKPGYINAAGQYLYYSRMNNTKNEKIEGNILSYSKVGIYRIDLDGSNIKGLYEDPSGVVNLYGNTLYYQHYNTTDGLKFYMVNIDNSGEEKLSDDAIMPLSILDNTLYYNGVTKDHNIYTMNLDTFSTSLLYKEECYAPILNNNYIYYMSLMNDYTIYRINLDGTNPTLILEDRCSTYNITDDGNYLYYQVDNNQNNGIYVLDLTTNETTLLKLGDFKQIHIAGNYVFFSDFLDEQSYYMPVGVNSAIMKFEPPTP